MIIIVTGSRRWTDRKEIWAELDGWYDLYGSTLTVRHGACQDRRGRLLGADKFAHEWCSAHSDVTEDAMPADWDAFGNAAGPIRNKEMVAKGANLVLAAPLSGPRSRSRGTWGCVDIARNYGIPVHVIEESG